jgi:hypothetical protein
MLEETKINLGYTIKRKERVQTIESLAVPGLGYSFGIVNWHQAELQKLERKTRKLLTIRGKHYSRTDVDRLYVPR